MKRSKLFLEHFWNFLQHFIAIIYENQWQHKVSQFHLGSLGMGGKLLAWRWGLSSNQSVKKDRSKSVNKSGKFRKVRFLEGSPGGSPVNDKEQKRVWFSRLWFSIRRKQNKRKSPTENNDLTTSVSPKTLVDLQCKFSQISNLFQCFEWPALIHLCFVDNIYWMIPNLNCISTRYTAIRKKPVFSQTVSAITGPADQFSSLTIALIVADSLIVIQRRILTKKT